MVSMSYVRSTFSVLIMAGEGCTSSRPPPRFLRMAAAHAIFRTDDPSAYRRSDTSIVRCGPA